MIDQMTSIMRAATSRTVNSESSPSFMNWKVVVSAEGRLATMPAKMMSEMPLPMPRSVTCSPSHMMKAVPAVSVIMLIRRKVQPGLKTTPPPPGA